VQTFSEILQLITDDLVDLGTPPDAVQISDLLRAKNVYLSESDLKHINIAAQTQLIGLGQLNQFVRPETTDILVNAPEEVWVDCGLGLQLHKNVFTDVSEVVFLARRLASLAGARLDDAKPFVDGRLPNGVRLHAILPPIAGACAQISLRLPTKRIIPLDSWNQNLTNHESELLAGVVAGNLSFVIAGETGSGKTTLLKSILSSRPRNQRIVLLEESTEIHLDQPNIISLATRASNTEGKGEISLQDLVRQTLRMRPDSIIIGEVRGGEILEFLLAISSGHLGSGTTIHAKVGKVEERIALLAQLANVNRNFAQEIFKSTIDVVIHCNRSDAGWQISQVIANREC
jgi:pilus assembly protein CpaF